MTHPVKSPKKLIEVALPPDAINVAAAREKSIRHGHPSTLHLWWARRPLAAARAVLFAQLLRHPDGVPTEYGWQRAVWTLELLARQLEADTGACLSSSQTRKALESFGNRIHLHFLPPYSQDHNQIERLWKQLHDHVTRNHRHPTMASLWKDVVRFLEQVQPFPGTKVSTLRMVA
jgi:adenine-specific DNA methylase